MPSKPTMAPTRNAAFSTSISSVALRLATSGLNSESRMTVSTLRPITPPAALMSSTAIWVAASISWASSAIGPVWGTTTPTLTACWPRARRLTKGNQETAVTAPAPARVLSIVRREVGLIVGPPLRGCEMCRRRAPLISRPRRPRPLPRRGRRGRLSRRHGPRPARRPHPRPDHPRARGGLLRRDASDRRARGGARLRLDLALRPLPDPRSRGLRGGRGHRARGRAAVARDTRRLRLGTSVLCHSYRAPSVLAKMAATLDVISGGRLDLGLGAGWFEQEYRAYGVPFPRIGERIDQLAEGIEIIRRMWTEPRPSYRGRHYAVDGAICDPPPVQRPHPPIWIGGEGDRVHRLAARAPDGVNVRWWGPERIAGRAAYLDAACREAGREPAALRRSVTALLVADRDAARADATRARFAGIPAEGHVAGTPEQCVGRIREYVAAGVRHFLFTIPDVASSGTLELVGRRVLPALRAEFATT